MEKTYVSKKNGLWEFCAGSKLLSPLAYWLKFYVYDVINLPSSEILLSSELLKN